MYTTAVQTIATLLLSNIVTCVPLATESPVRQVAIIGAGAAGSSTAYFLGKFAQESGVAVNITVLERTDRIGGRTKTVDPFQNASQRVELGASIFITENYILSEACAEFGLLRKEPYEDVLPLMGIWDGHEFVFTVDQSKPGWYNNLQIVLKYGFTSPSITQNLVKTAVSKFLKLYDKENIPFRSLTQKVYDLDLHLLTGVTGEQHLKANGVSDLFARHIVQASTRVNYASNLAYLHGLDTMVSMAPDGAVSVEGGNWQIFSNMMQRSGAHVSLNASVTSITQGEVPTKYRINAKASDSDNEFTVPVAFDDVVIAAPYQFSDIKTADNVIQQAIEDVPYVELHVTILASPFLVSPRFFNLGASDSVPGMILTTLAEDEDATSAVHGAGKAGFFSINILRKVVNPKTQRQEYLYKIFSPEKVTDDFLSRLFGVDVAVCSLDGEHSDAVEPVSWFYPYVFHSYPQALPRVTFQDPIVGAGVYYTSGMESFISTMETSALMGRNVARLIVDDMLTAAVPDESKQKTLVARDGQEIVGGDL